MTQDIFPQQLPRSAMIFVRHVGRFMERAQLFPSQNGRGLVALSGGPDSMALAFVLSRIFSDRSQKLLMVHFNHGTRPQNSEEEDFVRSFCREQSLELIVLKPTHPFSKNNFEHEARQWRYEKLTELADQPGDVIFTGHHLDDACESSLLHSMKASSLRPSLGIPVKRGLLRRPFLCVTRAQIMAFLKKAQIEYRLDPSNNDLKHERNFLRHRILSVAKREHPSLVKHFVDRSNELARTLGLSVFKKSVSITPAFTGPFGERFYFEEEKKIQISESEVIGAVRSVSLEPRGVLRLQAQKLLKAITSGKSGPLMFSGGVEAYLMPGLVCFLNQTQKEKYRELDRRYAEEIENFDSNTSQIPDLRPQQLISHLEQVLIKNEGMFPFWIICLPQDGLKAKDFRKCPHPLWPKLTEVCLKKGYHFDSAVRLIRFWDKSGKYRFRKVRLLPLWYKDGRIAGHFSR